ncbi:mechanosensitive ion channel family protein [Actinomadura flavalba]|uniref:mechanosensitive ion channel family protein n=1 Tax=Actinomadura flavalba TaxID=1120938 RepID=UPI00037D5B41|nr:mechanosensitive ion channel domain-containing protein [Actinomadura flavalba]
MATSARRWGRRSRRLVKTFPNRPRLARVVLLGGLAFVAALVSEAGDETVGPTGEPLLRWGGAIAFTALAAAATIRLGDELRRVSRPVLGPAHASVIRMAVILVGLLTTVIVMMGLLRLPIGQLVVGGALTGAVLGLAGQPTLSNMFAGMVLLYARPFGVGDRVVARSGPMGGELDGVVQEIGLLYVKIRTDDGDYSVPNSLMQNAAVARTPPATGP